MDMFSTSIPI
ncbi:hypothetical protein ANME2D_02242, partial [Candidatus Methanoperedens nitroreducens]